MSSVRGPLRGSRSRSPVRSYGAAPVSTSVVLDDAYWRQRIAGLFKVFNPLKLDSVNFLLQKYAGAEEKLCEAIVAKYIGSPGDAKEPSISKAAPTPPSLPPPLPLFEEGAVFNLTC